MSGLGAQSEQRIFLAVCETGNFVRAAEVVGLTASAVAKAIARLEGRLRVKVFHRTTRRLGLTPEGEIYQTVCRAALSEIDRVEASLASLTDTPMGLVRLSLPPLLGARIIAPALYALHDRYPGLRYDLSTDIDKVDLIERGIDVAVRVGALPDVAGLQLRQLGLQRVVLCASRSYFANRSVPETISDLPQHALIASSRRGRIVPWRFRGEQGAEDAWLPPARLTLDGALLAHGAIMAGQGLGMLPRWLVQKDIATGLVVPVLEDQVAGHLPIQAIWPSSSVTLPSLRVTLDAMILAVKKDM